MHILIKKSDSLKNAFSEPVSFVAIGCIPLFTRTVSGEKQLICTIIVKPNLNQRVKRCNSDSGLFHRFRYLIERNLLLIPAIHVLQHCESAFDLGVADDDRVPASVSFGLFHLGLHSR